MDIYRRNNSKAGRRATNSIKTPNTAVAFILYDITHAYATAIRPSRNECIYAPAVWHY
jgi:hypothetical protein